MLFVHGESYSWGSGNLYDGRVLASYGNVVVITVNYRLGVLGFLNTNTAPHQHPQMANYGLMDQIAALKWIQQNIAHFGGDPESVTMFGYRTGASCIHFLMQSPAAVAGLNNILSIENSQVSIILIQYHQLIVILNNITQIQQGSIFC